MKNPTTKKLIAFIIIGLMFCLTVSAQSEFAELKTQLQSKPQTSLQSTTASDPKSLLLAITPRCFCNLQGYGCGGLNMGCVMYCRSVCRRHALITDVTSNSTTIEFNIVEDVNVSLKLYDMTGRFITTLADNSYSVGDHSISWNTKDENGNSIAPGFYSIRMNAGDKSATEELIVMN